MTDVSAAGGRAAIAARQQGAGAVLTGLLSDTAALYGVLAEIEALGPGLGLLEVRKIWSPAAGL
jgi:hypothetical protein